MKTFKDALEKKIADSIGNQYGEDNHDEYRFGKFVAPQHSLVTKLKNRVKKLTNYNLTNSQNHFDVYHDKLNRIWENLSSCDRDLFVSILAYRILGSTKVKLPLNTPFYWEAIEKAKNLADKSDIYDPHFMHFILEKFDLAPLGYDIKLYFSEIAIAIDFILEQYAYKQNGKTLIEVNKGDYVIDTGGCWGDTALYFAHKTGENGKVFSFEFIPDNLKLFAINMDLNPSLKNRIELIKHPVSRKSNEAVYYRDNGPGSHVEMKPFEGQTGETTTLSIDDFIFKNEIERVDFIKMDIEGAEPFALEGAIKTIQKFRPKLAIAIYHGMDDFTNIPNWILDLNLGYEIFLGHYTIHSEETVVFAKLK